MPRLLKTFRLLPFPDAQTPLPFSIECAVDLHEPVLYLHCELQGDLSTIQIPARSPVAQRLRNLWQQTCFEFFIAPENHQHYWEFNLSPSQDWNVYYFTAYRQGMREETRILEMTSTVSQTRNSLIIQTAVDLELIPKVSTEIEIGIAYVLQAVQGPFQYWALSHGGQEPDFHRRDSFVLNM